MQDPSFRQWGAQIGKNSGSSEWLILTCTRPSEDAISLILQGLGNIPAEEVVAFLHAVAQKELHAALGSTSVDLPIVPTTDGVLKACSVTYFNNLGPQAGEEPLPPGYFLASDHVDKKLALKLGLSPLSDRVSSMFDDGSLVEMKEDLTTRISSVLLNYTKEQALMESLANAADAGATEFGVTLDMNMRQHSLLGSQQLVPGNLKKLCNQPFIVLHNNGVFSSSDWKGICSVGSGSKQGSVNGKPTIGRFGLGALSMFYFTEVLLTFITYKCVLTPSNSKVAMILSGQYVLFMDPRKAYLSWGRSCYRVSLETMKRYVNFISPSTVWM